MRPDRECVRCIVSVRLGEVISGVKDRDRSIELQLRVLEKAAELFRESDELTIIATGIFQWLIREAQEIADYYRELKRESILDAWSSIGGFRRYIEWLEGFDRFHYAVRLSIAGNILDTGVHGHTAPRSLGLEYVLKTPFGIDHTRKTYELLRSGDLRIAWLFDNAGESVYDTVLLEEIRSMGNYVVGIVKDDPGFQNDLTISDAYYAGIDEYVDEIVSTGCSCSSIHRPGVSEEAWRIIRDSDLIIAKGMAHYEYLSTMSLGRPVLHLLIPKCRPVASSLGVGKGVFVALLRD